MLFRRGCDDVPTRRNTATHPRALVKHQLSARSRPSHGKGPVACERASGHVVFVRYVVDWHHDCQQDKYRRAPGASHLHHAQEIGRGHREKMSSMRGEVDDEAGNEHDGKDPHRRRCSVDAAVHWTVAGSLLPSPTRAQSNASQVVRPCPRPLCDSPTLRLLFTRATAAFLSVRVTPSPAGDISSGDEASSSNRLPPHSPTVTPSDPPTAPSRSFTTKTLVTPSGSDAPQPEAARPAGTFPHLSGQYHRRYHHSADLHHHASVWVGHGEGVKIPGLLLRSTLSSPRALLSSTFHIVITFTTTHQQHITLIIRLRRLRARPRHTTCGANTACHAKHNRSAAGRRA